MAHTTKFIIRDKEHGIFLGYFLGLGFFSELDCAGQEYAVVFDSRTDAEGFLAEFKIPNCEVLEGPAEGNPGHIDWCVANNLIPTNSVWRADLELNVAMSQSAASVIH